jgi:hypothetical protein
VCGKAQYAGPVSEFSDGVETRRHEPSSGPPVGYLPYGERKPYASSFDVPTTALRTRTVLSRSGGTAGSSIPSGVLGGPDRLTRHFGRQYGVGEGDHVVDDPRKALGELGGVWPEAAPVGGVGAGTDDAVVAYDFSERP